MDEARRAVTVLLVDDERDFLQAAARALERRGFRVLPAASAGEARTLLQSRPEIDVAVLDVRLPDGDGHDLFMEMKKLYPDLAGIILTGNRDEHRAFNLSHKGLHAYLDKPCEVDRLAQAILEARRRGSPAEDAPPSPGPGPAEEGEPIRVLLIDDEEDFVKSLSRILARRGIVVRGAPSGEEGLRLLDAEPVDVAVIDLKMPGMDGLEVLRRIKARKPQVRVILLTGHATIESGVEGLKLGADDYLFKPQDPEELIRKIEYAASRGEKPRKKRSWWPFGRRS